MSLEPCLLFLVIFLWTPPHFWALSLGRIDDYARAGVPMLPIVAGLKETRRQILFYSFALVPVGAAPWLFGYRGLLYGASAILAGALLIALAGRVWRCSEGQPAQRAAQQLFAFSILYLFFVFAAMLVDSAARSAAIL
jgi:protoheme IX farnesyltransferase